MIKAKIQSLYRVLYSSSHNDYHGLLFGAFTTAATMTISQ